MALQKRERILAVAATAVVLLWVGLPRIKSVVFGAILDREARLNALQDRISKETQRIDALNKATRELQTVRTGSLPPNPYDAQRLYQAWLTDLAQLAGLKNLKVVPGRRIPHGQHDTAVLVSLSAEARAEECERFLYCFSRAHLAHRLTAVTMQPQAANGDPVFDLSLTAEGLAFSGVENRRLLFPQTELRTSFRSRSEPQSIDVADAVGFPLSAPFRVRIGNEYLTVTATDGTRWDVVGGVDGTRPASHSAGETVQSAPVHPATADRTWEQFHEVAKHLFVKPPPPKPAPGPKPTPRAAPVADREDPAADTYLTGSIRLDGRPQAWLNNQRRGERIVLNEGTNLKVSDIKAVVVEIGRDSVTLRTGDGLWRLKMGQPLRRMEKIAGQDGEGRSGERGRTTILHQMKENVGSDASDDEP